MSDYIFQPHTTKALLGSVESISCTKRVGFGEFILAKNDQNYTRFKVSWLKLSLAKF